MRIVMFYHSLLSDWNHGNAHFLRGVASELLLRGHDVKVYEPANGWSLTNLRAEHGEAPVESFYQTYPALRGVGISYDPQQLDLDAALEGADLVIVHEWNEHELVARIARHRAADGRYALLFHDTHHRAATDPAAMERYELAPYDGVLAYGRVLHDLYLKRRWAQRAWTWHEAADTRVFNPIDGVPKDGHVVWIGNWGDGERTAELHEFLLRPIKHLKLTAVVHGVRYPEEAKSALAAAGIDYRGWVANFAAPQVFARFRATVHVPRRPYVAALPGIPTIRVFEALACGIPLVCSPWPDVEGLFEPGSDFLIARDGREMQRHLSLLMNEPAAARELARHGRRTILARHTCAHRVEQLMSIVEELRAEPRRRVLPRQARTPAPRPISDTKETQCVPR